MFLKTFRSTAQPTTAGVVCSRERASVRQYRTHLCLSSKALR